MLWFWGETPTSWSNTLYVLSSIGQQRLTGQLYDDEQLSLERKRGLLSRRTCLELVNMRATPFIPSAITYSHHVSTPSATFVISPCAYQPLLHEDSLNQIGIWRIICRRPSLFCVDYIQIHSQNLTWGLTLLISVILRVIKISHKHFTNSPRILCFS